MYTVMWILVLAIAAIVAIARHIVRWIWPLPSSRQKVFGFFHPYWCVSSLLLSCTLCISVVYTLYENWACVSAVMLVEEVNVYFGRSLSA